MLLREHRGPLSADFRRYYGCNLADVLAGDVAPLSDVAAWAANLPPDSACARAMDPWDGQRTNEVELLRLIEFTLRVVNHNVRKDRFAQPPEPIPLPWDPKPDAVWVGVEIRWEDAPAALGGDERLARAMGLTT